MFWKLYLATKIQRIPLISKKKNKEKLNGWLFFIWRAMRAACHECHLLFSLFRLSAKLIVYIYIIIYYIII